MRIFVAGATGALGRKALPKLVADGHDVTAVARSDERAALVSRLGATPVRVDIFDRACVEGAVAGHDVVCNLATHIPRPARMALPSAWKENDRLRRVASDVLSAAAVSVGASRYVQESVAFLYADGGDRWLDESSPVDPVGYLVSATAAESHAARVTETGATGVVLRFAAFYGPESEQTRLMVRLARRRIAAGVGPDAYWSSIWIEDAGSAVAAAIRAPAGVFNVGDDEPLTRRALFDSLAAAIGAKPPAVAPRWTAVLGGRGAAYLARSQRVANGRFKEATGWAPSVPSASAGWAAVLQEMGA